MLLNVRISENRAVKMFKKRLVYVNDDKLHDFMDTLSEEVEINEKTPC